MTGYPIRAAILASLADSLAAENIATGHADDPESVYTDAGDLIAGVRDYIEGTQEGIAGTALAEVAFGFVAGYEYAEHGAHNADDCPAKAANAALRKAGLTL